MRQWLTNLFLRNLHKAIVLDDVVTIDRGSIYLGRHKISDQELRQLQAEAKAFETSRLWSIMTYSVRKIAQDKVFNQSTDFNQVMWGKTMLFNLDTIESIQRTFKEKL